MKKIMKTDRSTDKKEKNVWEKLMWRYCLLTGLMLVSTDSIFAQQADSLVSKGVSKPKAQVTGLRYISIHVLELEKILKLYREILGFKLSSFWGSLPVINTHFLWDPMGRL